MPLPQKTSKSSKEHQKIQAQREGIANGKEKGKARKELTGRDHAPNHHNPLSGQKPNDRHQHGLQVVANQGKRKN